MSNLFEAYAAEVRAATLREAISYAETVASGLLKDDLLSAATGAYDVVEELRYLIEEK